MVLDNKNSINQLSVNDISVYYYLVTLKERYDMKKGFKIMSNTLILF